MIRVGDDDALGNFLSEAMKNSRLTLFELQERTGFHRAKLGRLRLGQAASSKAEALSILRALEKPGGGVGIAAGRQDEGHCDHGRGD